MARFPIFPWRRQQRFRDVTTRVHLRESLVKQSQMLIDRGDYDLSMIITQTSLEHFTARALDRLIEYHKSQWVFRANLIQSYNIGDNRVVLIYNTLTGSKLQDRDKRVWQRLK